MEISKKQTQISTQSELKFTPLDEEEMSQLTGGLLGGVTGGSGGVTGVLGGVTGGSGVPVVGGLLSGGSGGSGQ